MRPSVSTWLGPLLAVVLVLIGWAFAYNYAQSMQERERSAFETARQAQVESCERVNILRAEVNVQIEVLQEFLLEAAQARQNAADAGSDPAQVATDQTTANRYAELAAQANPIETPNCEEIIPDFASFAQLMQTNPSATG